MFNSWLRFWCSHRSRWAHILLYHPEPEASKQAFSLSSFSLIKRLFSSSSISAVKSGIICMSEADISFNDLISPCDSLSPAFHMYSAYKLNKQGNNMNSLNAFPSQVWTWPILTVPCLTVHCWPVYMFLRAGKVVWYSHLLKNFPQFVVIHTKALASSVREKYMFSWNSLAFSMIQQMLAIWSLVPLPFLNTACTPGNSLKPSLKDFEPY